MLCVGFVILFIGREGTFSKPGKLWTLCSGISARAQVARSMLASTTNTVLERGNSRPVSPRGRVCRGTLCFFCGSDR